MNAISNVEGGVRRVSQAAVAWEETLEILGQSAPTEVLLRHLEAAPDDVNSESYWYVVRLICDRLERRADARGATP